MPNHTLLNRPGTINQVYTVMCHLCTLRNGISFPRTFISYETASIEFTRHLDNQHPGWDKEEEINEQTPAITPVQSGSDSD